MTSMRHRHSNSEANDNSRKTEWCMNILSFQTSKCPFSASSKKIQIVFPKITEISTECALMLTQATLIAPYQI